MVVRALWRSLLITMICCALLLFPASLHAQSGGASIRLTWTNPSDPDFAGTIVRFSTESYPSGIEEGRGVPNGGGGLFRGDPGSSVDFMHTGLEEGKTYYYAAYAFDEVPNFSPAARALGRPADRTAPGLTVALSLEWPGGSVLELHVSSTEPLDTQGVEMRAGDALVSLSPDDSTGSAWRGGYDLSGSAGVLRLEASVRDTAGNETAVAGSLSVSLIRAEHGGLARSADGLFRVWIGPGSLVDDVVLLILPGEGGVLGAGDRWGERGNPGRTFTVMPEGLQTVGMAEVAFRYLDEGGEPDRFFVRDLRQALPLRSYVDTESGLVSASVATLGAFELATGRAGANTPVDPRSLLLDPNEPNPFNPVTRIPFEIRAFQQVVIDVHSISGERIRRLLDQTLPPGRHDAHWNGRDDRGREVASGIYFCRIETAVRTATRKMTLVR